MWFNAINDSLCNIAIETKYLQIMIATGQRLCFVRWSRSGPSCCFLGFFSRSALDFDYFDLRKVVNHKSCFHGYPFDICIFCCLLKKFWSSCSARRHKFAWMWFNAIITVYVTLLYRYIYLQIIIAIGQKFMYCSVLVQHDGFSPDSSGLL